MSYFSQIFTKEILHVILARIPVQCRFHCFTFVVWPVKVLVLAYIPRTILVTGVWWVERNPMHLTAFVVDPDLLRQTADVSSVRRCITHSVRAPNISNPARGCAGAEPGKSRPRRTAPRSGCSPVQPKSEGLDCCSHMPLQLAHCWLIWMLQGSSGVYQETKRINSRGFRSFSILFG